MASTTLAPPGWKIIRASESCSMPIRPRQAAKSGGEVLGDEVGDRTVEDNAEPVVLDLDCRSATSRVGS
jgi:hypothetical protein